MICKCWINDNYIYVNCNSEDDNKRHLEVDVYDIDNGLKLFDFHFDFLNTITIWNKLNYDLNIFTHVNGFKINIINLDTGQIEYSEVLMARSYLKNKFIDKDNILSHFIIVELNHNLLETFHTFKDDALDIKNDEVLLDLGSSIGIFTAYALEQNPNLKCICVELNSKFHKVCSDTFAHNPNVIPINAAIYKESGVDVTIFSPKEDLYDLGTTIVDNLYGETSKYTEHITTVSVDHIITKYGLNRISLMKVDIEGYEYELIEQMSDEILSKIDKIFLEFHQVEDRSRRFNVINKLMLNGFHMKVYNPTINFYSDYMFSLFFTR
jgi:FkbM family methyltransferase